MLLEHFRRSRVSIKIPAIKSTIGTWTYYTGTLTFGEISKYVKKIDNELHKSDSLREALQRSLTDNYLSIKDYILNQEERFFNAIVLAIYDGNPNWIEVELEIENDSFYNLGFLALSGDEKVFPVDGQHRVEGIKSALIEDPSLKDERVSVIFIGHKTTPEGMQKSRRLFNALNRYAKPVSMSDIIALDEDDSSAMSTRYLIEDSENITLFNDDRLIHAKQKAIPDSNKKAFTSLITLYQLNNEILRYYFQEIYFGTDGYIEYKNRYYPDKSKKVTIKEFIKYRPKDETLKDFFEFNEKYWVDFINNFEFIKSYLEDNTQTPAQAYRNKVNGGNILFRPIGIGPFVSATLEYMKERKVCSFDDVFKKFNKIELSLNKKPWLNTVWQKTSGKIESSINKTYIKDMMLFLVSPDLLDEKRKNTLKERYAEKISYNQDLKDISMEDMLLL